MTIDSVLSGIDLRANLLPQVGSRPERNQLPPPPAPSRGGTGSHGDPRRALTVSDRAPRAPAETDGTDVAPVVAPDSADSLSYLASSHATFVETLQVMDDQSPSRADPVVFGLTSTPDAARLRQAASAYGTVVRSIAPDRGPAVGAALDAVA